MILAMVFGAVLVCVGGIIILDDEMTLKQSFGIFLVILGTMLMPW